MTKILVIEDEASIRETIKDTLEFADYEVQVARNGVEGVQLAHTFGPELILCDVMMPELDGYGVLLELGQIPQLSQVPFIFLTAKASREDMRQGMASGADDYLTKPFTSHELLDSVNSRLERHLRIKKYNTQQMEFVRQYINLTLPHELRTPLSGIVGYLYMLEGFEDMDATTIRKMLGSLKNATTRLGGLVENYIAYGQVQLIHNDPELMEQILEFSKLDNFDEFAFQIIDSIAFDLSRLDDLSIELDSASVHIFFDHAKKLITEIIKNAFKFSEVDTPVTVRGKVEEGRYVLSVSNEGRGMTEEQINLIRANNQFEREKYEQQGAGLGLAICQYIMGIYDGELLIESAPEGMTTVNVILNLI